MRPSTARRLATLTVLGLAGALATSASAAVEPSSTQFFLNSTGCGADQGPTTLSTTIAADDSDGCGTIGGLPFNEVLAQAEVDIAEAYGTVDGMPLTLDASRDAEGVIAVQSWAPPGPSLGQVVVEVSLEGNGTDKKFVALGGDRTEVVVAGAASQVDVPFSIDLPASAQGRELRSLTLSVTIRGINVNGSARRLEGDSSLTVPTLVTVAEETTDEPATVE